tara:strand:+ start:165 stop:410 length:246 start_codon:yes stop_codon:yes gene_type:complete
MMKESIKEVLKCRKTPTFDYEIDSYQQIDEDEYVPTRQTIKLTDAEYYATMHDNSMNDIRTFRDVIDEPTDSDEESDSDYD